MNCPDCGLPTWTYDEELVTCKRGHRNPAVGSDDLVPFDPRPRIRVSLAWPLTVVAAVQFADLVLNLF